MHDIAIHCSSDEGIREEYERLNRQIHWESIIQEGPQAGQRASPTTGVKPGLRQMFPLLELLTTPPASVEEAIPRYKELGVAPNASKANALARTLMHMEAEIKDLYMQPCYEAYTLIGEGYLNAVHSLCAVVLRIEEELCDANASGSASDITMVDGASNPAELGQ